MNGTRIELLDEFEINRLQTSLGNVGREEESVARDREIVTWRGRQGSLNEWSQPRFFAVPETRAKKVRDKGALDELLSLPPHRLSLLAWQRRARWVT